MNITPTELRALIDAANGRSAIKSSELHGISVHTVREQRSYAIRKMGALKMTDAVAIAFRQGIIRKHEILGSPGIPGNSWKGETDGNGHTS